ncbi:DUF1566 domain-containing protein [Dysgonomonas sp. 521]|uniref:FISUMP domain-containing protein n=1 Tax=Dysgonomonas sp. 521 TaxID=2302932 RepID=UPI0013D23253|nr:FISUMP domain-containing protein [Dysgonomonas sp. 521]NDV96695.1 DUF1566 domain-containing protein [Dysgonomonas sp. 521]
MKTTKTQNQSATRWRLLTVLIALMLLCPFAKAQVTVGSGDAPQDFSILEIVSNDKGGLRLPQLTTLKRNELQATQKFKDEIILKGRGLTIFNTDTRCVEYWNGLTWIANCEDSSKPECIEPCDCDGDGFKAQDCGGDDPDDYDPCNPGVSDIDITFNPTSGYVVGEPVTITVTGTGAAIKRLSLDGGKTFTEGNTIIVTPGKVGDNIYKIMVNNCSSQEVPITLTDVQPCTPITTVGIGGCTPYMFDYQTLKLTATPDANATSYQWLMDGVPISGATSKTLSFSPRDLELETDALGNRTKLVNITCKASNACTATESAPYPVLVVGVQIDANGLAPINLNAVDENGNTLPPLTFAHVNLGAEYETDPCRTWGDLYQWGRKADGHEKRNSPRYPNDDDSEENGIAGLTDLDADGQIAWGNPRYGKFIKQKDDPMHWYPGLLNTLWGDGSSPVQGSINNYNQPKAKNDPCPAGWKVPSQKQWQAIYKPTGDGDGVPQDNTLTNNWGINGSSAKSYIVGMALNLPFAGKREYDTGENNRKNEYGYYWSTTHDWRDVYQLYLDGPGAKVNPNNHNHRTFGLSVRCVKENGYTPPKQCEAITDVTVKGITAYVAGQTITLQLDAVTPASADATATISYQWYKGNKAITGATSATLTIDNCTTADAGNYWLMVGNDCSSNILSASVNVTVISSPSTLPLGEGVFKGIPCFDVVETNEGGGCGTLANRASQKADFSQEEWNTQDYTFDNIAGGVEVSKIRFYAVDQTGLVIESITPKSTTWETATNLRGIFTVTVKYKTTLNNDQSLGGAGGRDRNNALNAMLYVVYNADATGVTTNDKYLELKVSVQDCTCCPGYLALGGEYVPKAPYSYMGAHEDFEVVKNFFTATGKDVCFYKKDAPGDIVWNTVFNTSACSINNGYVAAPYQVMGSWRLPTLAELGAIQSIHNDLSSQPTSASGTDNFRSVPYWSNTEHDEDIATIWNFGSGYAFAGFKNTASNARCVRTF